MKTILILDDESGVRQSLFDYFEDHLWNPIMAESAEDALLLIEKEKPVAAIVDVRLPGMNGSDFIREAVSRNIFMVFVICSGSSEYEFPQDLKSMACVCDDFFKKPVQDLVTLENQLSSMIQSCDVSPGQQDD